MEKKPDQKLMNRQTRATLTVILLAAILLAIWLFVSPTLDMQQRMARQTALLDSIATGGTITLPERFVAEADYYNDNSNASVVEGMALPPDKMAEDAPTAEPDNGVITGLGILTIDRIDLRLPVVEGVTLEQLEISVGHVPQTAAIGDTGNAVIAGHRSYEYGQLFNRLGEVQTGDVILYQPKGGEAMTFVVDEILEIVPSDQTAFVQPEDKAQMTLYTCTPIREATHRLLIRATRKI